MINTKFEKLSLSDWRQFQSVELELHKRLTVLTGSNGSGKSTLLNIFAQHFGWQRPYLATPRRLRGSDQYQYVTGWRARRRMLPSSSLDSQMQELGKLFYSNDTQAVLQAPNQTEVQFHLHINGQAQVKGLHIPSHRALPFYQQVSSIPTNALSAQQAYSNYFGETMQRFNGGHTPYGATYRLKESLISMATFGLGNQYVQGNKAALQSYVEFEEVLRKVLPKSIGFERLAIRTPDVVLITNSGDFLIDASSGGIMSLVDLAWQIHLYATSNPGENFVITMDEPENHLHPSMQRSLLADLMEAFPHAQFIVATHSPFMVSSVRDSNVFVLKYVDETVDLNDDDYDHESHKKRGRKVLSQKLDNINRAGSANEILREVLGVPATVPEWVEDDLKVVIAEFRSAPISNETLNQMRAKLDALGFGQMYPRAVADLVSGQ